MCAAPANSRLRWSSETICCVCRSKAPALESRKAGLEATARNGLHVARKLLRICHKDRKMCICTCSDGSFDTGCVDGDVHIISNNFPSDLVSMTV
jgi:hypothetical protein